MEVEKNWVIKITESERHALDYWFVVCKDQHGAGAITCKYCAYQIECAKLAMGLELEED